MAAAPEVAIAELFAVPKPMSSVPSHFPEAEEHKASGANLIPTEPVVQDTLPSCRPPLFSRR